MKLLPLTRGQFAIVDDEDYDAVSQVKWTAQENRSSFYAMRTQRINGWNKKIYLHRQIMAPKTGEQVDHKNGDSLDCRRENLRAVTAAQNKAAFRAKLPGVSSRFRGVRWEPCRGKWTAQITVDYKFIHLGTFLLETDAAVAYNTAAKTHFGEFAQLNKLD